MSDVLNEMRGQVLWLTINRPEQRNAFNASVMRGLGEGLVQAQQRSDVRAVVITGAGERAFCAGGDLSPSADGAPFSVNPARPRNYVVDFFKHVESCDVPVIARVNGHALAGGCGHREFRRAGVTDRAVSNDDHAVHAAHYSAAAVDGNVSNGAPGEGR
jgi:enoyl-CoA hydratase/carnithine racemase